MLVYLSTMPEGVGISLWEVHFGIKSMKIMIDIHDIS